MILEHLFCVLMTLFPFSFIAYLLSERSLAIHQSRVGLGQSLLGFCKQGCINLFDLFQNRSNPIALFLFCVQFSFLGLVPFAKSTEMDYPLTGGFYICLIVTLISSVLASFQASYSEKDQVQARIQKSHRLTYLSIGTVLAFICVLSCFSIAGSWSLSEVGTLQQEGFFHWGIFWSPVQIVFFILFQISGMILFEEHPFESGFLNDEVSYTLIHSKWIASARFYCWSMVSVILFFGGDSFLIGDGGGIGFLVLQIKAGLVYAIFRLIGFYLPKHSVAEGAKVLFLFLIPLSLAALVFVLLFNAIPFLGESSV